MLCFFFLLLIHNIYIYMTVFIAVHVGAGSKINMTLFFSIHINVCIYTFSHLMNYYNRTFVTFQRIKISISMCQVNLVLLIPIVGTRCFIYASFCKILSYDYNAKQFKFNSMIIIKIKIKTEHAKKQ